jgi:O-antigen biosynthesis protein
MTRDFVYLVYSPELVHWSAGIKVLHKLSNSIAETGRESILVNHGSSSLEYRRDLGRKIRALKDSASKKIPIAIYPESVTGNPLGCSLTIRWILNLPGILGGEHQFNDTDIWSYSRNLSDEYFKCTGIKSSVVFIPALELEEFSALKEKSAETRNSASYDLVYAQKFRALGGEPQIESKNKIEITRFDNNSTNRENTLELIRNARSIHVFENSTVITEAQLFGVPVYCYRNPNFPFLIAEHELGNDGISWNPAIFPKTNQEKTLTKFQVAEATYLKNLKEELERFEHKLAEETIPHSKLFSPWLLSSRHKVSRMKAVAKTHGGRGALRFITLFIKRRVNATKKPGKG